MECLRNRLESFSKPVRVQTSSKAGASKSVKWPHPDDFLANPTSLAEAGFYFNPSYEDRDNVTCFTCDKQLSEWEAEDDPFDIHWSKCAKVCCWAVVRCGLRQDLDSRGRFAFPERNRLPNSKSMEKARLQTYTAGDGWMHDNTKNHGANSKKMAKAGFVFTPEHKGDDLATCLYCGICLSSWDTEDDPLEHHRKRKGDECPFFNSPTAAGSITKGRSASGASKPSSRASTAPARSHTRGRSRSGMQDVVEQQEEPTTTARRPLRARKTVAPVEEGEAPAGPTKPGKPRSVSRAARKPSRSQKMVVPVEEAQSEAEPGEIETLPVAAKINPSRKSSRSRKTIPLVEEEEPQQTELGSQDSDPPEVLIKPIVSKKSSRSRKTVAPSAEVEESRQQTRKPKPRSKSGARKTQPAPSPSSPLAQVIDADEEEMDELVLTKKPPKSKKAAAKLPTDEETEELVVPKKKGTRSKKVVAKTVEENLNTNDGEDEPTMNTKAQNAPNLLSETPEPNVEAASPAKQPVKQELAARQGHVEADVEEVPKKGSEAKRATAQRIKQTPKPEYVELSEHQIEPEVPQPPEIGIDELVPISATLAPVPSAIPQLSQEACPPTRSSTPRRPQAEPTGLGQSPPVRSPQTPAHKAPEAVPTPIPPEAESNPQPAQEPIIEFTPCLSKLPFIPLHSLAEAELDMTVEEWIRYQIEVEYDKFKRDGERELLRFRQRAEEVRKIIERL